MKKTVKYSITAERNKDYSLFSVLVSVISIVIGFLSINNYTEGTIYRYFFIIPFLFGVLNLLFFKVYSKLTLSSALVIGFMLIRYVITPLILYIERYPRSIYYTEIINSSQIYAVFIMCYEMFLIFIVLNKKKKSSNTISDEEYIIKATSKENFGQLNILLIGVIGLTCVIFIAFPSLFGNYSFIVNANLDSLVADSEIQQANLPFGMRWIGYTLGEATRYIVIDYTLIRLFKKYERDESSLYWWLSILIITVNACFTTSRIMLGLLMSISLYYQTYKLFPKMRKFFLRVGIGLGLLVILVIAYTYLSNALSYHSLSQMIQGYTNGFYNVYQARNAYLNYSQDWVDKIATFLLGDGLGNVNVISRFINSINSSDIYNHYIYGGNFNGGAVVPLVSQMSYYFTFAFGPFATYFCLRIMDYYEIKNQNGKGNMLINQFLAVTLGATPFMYNYSTILHIITVVVIPIWLFSWINKHVVLRMR